MKKIVFLWLILCMAFSVCPAQENSVIEPELQSVLNRRSVERIPVNIVFKSKIDAGFLKAKIALATDKKSKRETFVRELKTFAANTQADVLSYLRAEETNGKVADIESHWITNVISCSATADVIYTLSQMPDIDVIGHDAEQKIVQGEASDEQLLPSYSSSEATPHILQINADDVWNLGYTGKNVVVAVLDSGINPEHYDLKDHLWRGYADTDGDGEEDDVINGWNFIADNENITDDYSEGHGTHCAGLVCGDGTWGNITGVAPDATLMTVKIVNRAGGGSPADMISGVEFAIANGADVLSISLGFKTSMIGVSGKKSLRDTFVKALDAGVIVCAAAGNDGENITAKPVPENVDIPAACPPPYLHPDQAATNTGGLSSVVCVGAVNANNEYASFSSVGPVTWQDTEYDDYLFDDENIGLIRPDICAPGYLIYSLSHNGVNTYKYMSGTSQATPIVAGVMALMLEKNPDLTPAEICEIIETTARKSNETKNNYYGSGVIDALEAVNKVEESGGLPFVKILDYTPNKLIYASNNTLKIDVVNIGKGALSEQAKITLSANDPYITIQNAEQSLGEMAANEIKTISFDILASDNAFIGHTVYVTATIEDGNLTWMEDINFVIESEPKIVYKSMTPGMVKAGENVTLSVDIINNGNAPTTNNTDVQLKTNSQYVTIVQGVATVGVMAVGDVKTVEFVVNISQDIPDNSNVSFDLFAVPNNYTDVKNLFYEFEQGVDDSGYIEDGFCGWTTIDANNDGENDPWWHSSEYASHGVENMEIAHSGRGHLLSQTVKGGHMPYSKPIDNYLISPQIRVTEDSKMSFMARYHSTYPIEHFGVAVSESGNYDASLFTTIGEWEITKEDGDDWIEFNVDLSAYEGKDIYVAIRHFYTEEQWYDPNYVDEGFKSYILHVDDVCFYDIIDMSYDFKYNNYSYFGVIVESNPLLAPTNVVAQMLDKQSISLSWSAVTNAQSYNIYRDGEYLANTSDVAYTDTGLNADTEYSYYVAAVYNGKVYEASGVVSAVTDKADYSVVVKSYSPATLVPGENKLYVTMLNNGKKELNSRCTVTFACDDPYISISSNSFGISALSAGAESVDNDNSDCIKVNVSENTPNGYIVNFTVNVKEMFETKYEWNSTSSIVVYNENAIDISEQKATAKALVDGWGGVGYPVADAIERYLAAVDAAESSEDITAAQNALLAADIQMPENGKAYTFTNVQKNGTEIHMYYSGTGMALSLDATNLTPFICRDLGEGKYAFVNNAGKYLICCSHQYEYDDRGCIDSYVAGQSEITIAKMNASDNNVSAQQIELAGLVSLAGNRKKEGNPLYSYFVIKSDNTFNGAEEAYYDGDYSSAFRLREASYANTPQLNSVAGSTLISGADAVGKSMATFSAPFATVLPDGVSAYYAESGINDDYEVRLTEYEGAALPANQGFILVGDNAGKVTMVPAAGEETTAIAKNLFGHSAGAAITLAQDQGYLLTGGSQGAGFYACNAGTLAMNKAYLPIPASAQRSIVIRFPGTTDIDSVVVEGENMGDALIYDLSGRRVERPSRGIYIVNGKKMYFK